MLCIPTRDGHGGAAAVRFDKIESFNKQNSIINDMRMNNDMVSRTVTASYQSQFSSYNWSISLNHRRETPDNHFKSQTSTQTKQFVCGSLKLAINSSPRNKTMNQFPFKTAGTVTVLMAREFLHRNIQVDILPYYH